MKQAAYGSRIAVQYGQAGAFNLIASVGDFSGPEITAETIDVTTHDSADHFNEFLAGMADGGEVPFDMVFDSASAAHETLYNAVADRALHNFQIQLPGFVNTAGGGYFAFTGLFTKMGVTLPVKDKVGSSVNIKVSGKPVFHKFV